jgi:hypothetical protein
LPVVLRCDAAVGNRVRYVFDTLFCAANIAIRYSQSAPDAGPWLLYAQDADNSAAAPRALFITHDPQAWRALDEETPLTKVFGAEDQCLVLGPPVRPAGCGECAIGFDLAANAFCFLSSWAERRSQDALAATRQLYASSTVARLGLPQDIVDGYLAHLLARLDHLHRRLGMPFSPPAGWPRGATFAMALTHDVDYLPVGPLDNAVQGVKAVLRHLVRQRDPIDAVRALRGWLAALARGRDPYGDVANLIERELALGVRSSFQVAVGHRHPNDVNYRIEDDSVRDRLRAIEAAGFEVALHGSYRSTEDPRWYVEEVELLTQRLARPVGSRQHFLSFDYDHLFAAQEMAGVRYDMSMGYPDRPGPRSGFSYPYFPYNLTEDRPYRVLQVSLFLMDVTLRSYMNLRPEPARAVIDDCLVGLQRKRGAASAVWHPIVFGDARDPGYGELYFDMARRVGELGGLATDGRTIDALWRERARRYASFRFA